MSPKRKRPVINYHEYTTNSSEDSYDEDSLASSASMFRSREEEAMKIKICIADSFSRILDRETCNSRELPESLSILRLEDFSEENIKTFRIGRYLNIKREA